MTAEHLFLNGDGEILFKILMQTFLFIEEPLKAAAWFAWSCTWGKTSGPFLF
jgi:hypothetical protein